MILLHGPFSLKCKNDHIIEILILLKNCIKTFKNHKIINKQGKYLLEP